MHHRSELGGAPASLSYLIRELERDDFDAHIYCPPGPAAELFRQAGAEVHTGPVAGFTHIWASTYRGRRWLLFLRELAFVPAHVVRFRRILRRNRFELVHLNDSPLIPAAWLARRRSLPVVWHLRSALPGEGSSSLISRAITSPRRNSSSRTMGSQRSSASSPSRRTPPTSTGRATSSSRRRRGPSSGVR